MVVLSNMVTTRHMWLFTFKLIKMKKRKNAVPQMHWSHFKC